MSLEDDRQDPRRRKADPVRSHEDSPSSRKPLRKKKAPGDVGQALRSAYTQVVEEDIPPEMLDLLGKLG